MESVTEMLGLVNVDFDAIDKENSIKVVHNIESESGCFKEQIETEFPDRFKGISYMDGVILIKLHDGAIPHTELIRRYHTQCNNH